MLELAPNVLRADDSEIQPAEASPVAFRLSLVVIGFPRHLECSYFFERLIAPPFVTIPMRMHQSPSRSFKAELVVFGNCSRKLIGPRRMIVGLKR